MTKKRHKLVQSIELEHPYLIVEPCEVEGLVSFHGSPESVLVCAIPPAGTYTTNKPPFMVGEVLLVNMSKHAEKFYVEGKNGQETLHLIRFEHVIAKLNNIAPKDR